MATQRTEFNLMAISSSPFECWWLLKNKIEVDIQGMELFLNRKRNFFDPNEILLVWANLQYINSNLSIHQILAIGLGDQKKNQWRKFLSQNEKIQMTNFTSCTLWVIQLSTSSQSIITFYHHPHFLSVVYHNRTEDVASMEL